jgi:predicted nuclease of predicted toxin-antitoxin system
MKFLADMGISPIVVARLRSEGHTVDHLAERRLHKSTDLEIIELAIQEERIVLTHDLDFGYLLAIHRFALPSIIIFRLKDMRPNNVLNHLLLAIFRHEPTLTAGALLVVTERRIRVRNLPL